ncbi:MAG: biotin synthase BioB [Chitinivibrionales bacterium]
MIDELTDRVIAGERISKQDALEISSEQYSVEDLLSGAERIKETFCGKGVYRCAIVNAKSGACSEDCAFCAQSVHHNTEAETYPFISYDELLRQTIEAKRNGVNCLGVVTSGPVPDNDEIEMVAQLCRDCADRGITGLGASLGIITKKDLIYLKESGLAHYNHNLETSERFYPSICTTHSWKERYDTVKAAVDTGLEVCSGGIFGLGESFEDRVDMAFALRELKVQNIPLNFLSPIKGTPMESTTPLSQTEALRIIAVYRFIFPDGILRICGGRQERLASEGEKIFKAGATGILTGDYLTTKGSSFESDYEMIKGAGLFPKE